MENPPQNQIGFGIFLVIGLVGLVVLMFTQSVIGTIAYFIVYLTVTFYIIQRSYDDLHKADKSVVISSMHDSQYPSI